MTDILDPDELTDDHVYGALDRVCPVCGMPEGYYCMPVEEPSPIPDSVMFLHRERIPADE